MTPTWWAVVALVALCTALTAAAITLVPWRVPRPTRPDQAAVLRAADATEMFLRDGIERVMNAFNAADKEEREDSAE